MTSRLSCSQAYLQSSCFSSSSPYNLQVSSSSLRCDWCDDQQGSQCAYICVCLDALDLSTFPEIGCIRHRLDTWISCCGLTISVMELAPVPVQMSGVKSQTRRLGLEPWPPVAKTRGSCQSLHWLVTCESDDLRWKFWFNFFGAQIDAKLCSRNARARVTVSVCNFAYLRCVFADNCQGRCDVRCGQVQWRRDRRCLESI